MLPAAGLARRQDREIDLPGKISSGTAFYRKYTERLLRRYMRTALDIGRCPSVLGNVAFRGKSSYMRARSFEDAVIFVHDVETCLGKLDRSSRELIARITLQDYTQHEAAQMLSTSVRSVMRRYAEALDRLTEVLLAVDLLDTPRY
jgi:hypothetical protein